MKQLSPIGIKLLESLKAKPINEDQINQLLLNESLDDEEKQLLLQTFKKWFLKDASDRDFIV
ncbi:MAG: hypothetical protein IPM34_10900 [Saprospiraceae bacterium]|nr:hypothetical protein [Saprospiraceae bacterium]